jgi:hypothetical protein
MEIITDVEKIKSAASAAGVKPEKLDKAISLNSLPDKGSFVGWSIQTPEIDGEERPYLAIHCNDGSMMSLNTIQAIVHTGSLNDVKLKQVTKPESAIFGKYVISGKALNPHLSGNQAEVIAKLIGKNFTTTTIQAIVIPYTKMADTEEETKKHLTTKDYYKITLK